MAELPHQRNSQRGRAAEPSVTIGSAGACITVVKAVADGNGATAYVDAGDAGGFYIELSSAMCAFLAGFLASAGGVER